MRGWGIMLLVLGIGSFILPMMGLQFKLLQLFGEYEQLAGGAMAVVGLGMVVLSSRSGGDAPPQQN